MSSKSICSACKHHRLAAIPDPFEGLRLASAKVFELRTKWQTELANRAALEEQRYLAAQPFDFEPVAYPWCFKFSGVETSVDASTGEALPVFVLCVQRNPDGMCTEFTGVDADG